MSTTRRMGPIDSEMAGNMLDAAEAILRDEGYAALTSRRVSEYAGVKQRLVYYYFRTMDDLIIECFRRLAARDLARLKHAVASDHPLHDIWEICINSTDARLVSEFMALANRNEGLRQEVVQFIEKSRDHQIAAIKKALPSEQKKNALHPAAIALLGTSVALALNRESAVGVKKGHQAVKTLIKQYCDSIEP